MESSSKQQNIQSKSQGTSDENTESANEFNQVTSKITYDDGKPLCIRLGNLPRQPIATKDMEEVISNKYKDLGTITNIKIFETAEERYAMISFQSGEGDKNVTDEPPPKKFRESEDKEETKSSDESSDEGNLLRNAEPDNGGVKVDEYHPNAARTLVVKNIPWDVTIDNLHQLFRGFGDILTANTDMTGALRKGYCEFFNVSSAVKAINTLNGTIWRGHTLMVEFDKRRPTTCVWTQGIPDSYTEPFLDAIFNPSETATKITVDYSRGQAMAYYATVDQAKQIVDELRGFFLNGRRMQSDFASLELQAVFHARLEKNAKPTSFYFSKSTCNGARPTIGRPYFYDPVRSRREREELKNYLPPKYSRSTKNETKK